MKIEVNSLLGTIYAMDGYLDDYKDPDHGYIAVFSTDEKEDISKIREMRTAMALVAGWYGKEVEPLKPIERSEDITGTCAVELIRENEDGSAGYAFDFTDEQVRAFTRLGIMTAITAGLGEAKKLDPVSKEETIVFKVETEGDNILALAEAAGFCMWGNESHKPEGATIDWSCNYDEELVKFAELIIEDAESEAISLIKFIARDYVELSHDKVLWQRNDYIKRCQKFLDEYRRVKE